MKNIEIIGALHFNPLPGFEGFTSLVEIYKKAEIDCENFVNGGIKSIIIENNYDLPHKINVGAETVASMTWLGAKLKQRFPKITFGVSVLWNDYRAAFSIAKAINAKFIRIPVFVDSVITDFGEINATPKEVIKFQDTIYAKDIEIYADIQVKHAKMINTKKTLIESAKEAIQKGADKIIITGAWTGDLPKAEEVKSIRQQIPNAKIIIGSGITKENIITIAKHIDGAIVSTALKEGQKTNERNLKPYTSIIDSKKVADLIKMLK
jgi:hypothetical protein